MILGKSLMVSINALDYHWSSNTHMLNHKHPHILLLLGAGNYSHISKDLPKKIHCISCAYWNTTCDFRELIYSISATVAFCETEQDIPLRCLETTLTHVLCMLWVQSRIREWVDFTITACSNLSMTLRLVPKPLQPQPWGLLIINRQVHNSAPDSR